MTFEFKNFYKERNFENKKETSIQRQPGLDLIRVSACFLVMLIHVSCQLFYDFSPSWSIAVAYDSISRMCVPLFLLLSGYLLLDGKNIALKKFYSTRLLKVIVPFIIFLQFYNFFIPNTGNFHLWYVHIIIGIYIIIPAINKIINTNFIYKYTIIWFLYFSIIDTLYCYAYNRWPSMSFELNIFSVLKYSGYCIIGGLLRNIVIKNNFIKLLLCVGFIFSCIIIYFSTTFYSTELGKPQILFAVYTCPYVFFQSIFFFLTVKDLTFKNSIIQKISIHTYWMYLLHLAIIEKTISILNINLHNNALITIPAVTVSVFFISFVLSFPMIKIEKYIIHIFYKLTLIKSEKY